MKPPIKIAICVPSQDVIKSKTTICIAGLTHYSITRNINPFILNLEGATVSKARNNLVREALKFEADYLFFLDSDMIVPAYTLEHLLRHDKDIVAITYNKRAPPYETLGHLKGPPKDISAGGLHEADFMPGGAMLVKADVFRKMGYPWFYETYFWDDPSPSIAFVKMIADWSLVDMPISVRSLLAGDPAIQSWLESNQAHKGMFAEGIDMVSEDYNFCLRARRHGYQIWCDISLTYETGHIGNQVVTCQPQPKVEVDA